MGNESKLDHKLASLVGMLNRSSDWQAVPEIIMLTFIEVTDLLREQSKAIREANSEIKQLKKEAKARAGEAAAMSPVQSMVLDNNILDQLSDLQHHSNNRHRRSRSRAAMVDTKNGELGLLPGQTGECSDENNSDYEGGSPSPKPNLPPTPVATLASPVAQPPSALRSGMAGSRKTATDSTSSASSATSTASSTTAKPRSRGVRFGSDNDGDETAKSVTAGADAPGNTSPKGAGHGRSPSVKDLANVFSKVAVPITFSDNQGSRGSGLVKQSSGGDLADSAAKPGSRKAPTATTSAAATAPATDAAAAGAAAAAATSGKTKSRGVRFASEDDVHVFSMKLDDFNYETALSKMNQSGESTAQDDTGAGDKATGKKKKSSNKELIFVFENDDGSVSYGDAKGNDVQADTNVTADKSGAQNTSNSTAGSSLASGKKKAKKSVQFREDDDVQVIYDYHDSPMVSPMLSPVHSSSNEGGDSSNNSSSNNAHPSSVDMAADLDKILDDVIQSNAGSTPAHAMMPGSPAHSTSSVNSTGSVSTAAYSSVNGATQISNNANNTSGLTPVSDASSPLSPLALAQGSSADSSADASGDGSAGTGGKKKAGTGRRLLRVFMRKRKDTSPNSKGSSSSSKGNESSETGSVEENGSDRGDLSDDEDEEISPELAMLINALAST